MEPLVLLLLWLVNSSVASAFACFPGDRCTVKAVNMTAVDCQNWNATFLVQEYPIQGQISVSFYVCCKYSTCFENFEMFLYMPYKDDCNEGFLHSRKIFRNNVSGNSLLFNDLDYGSYCVRVIPIDEACEGKKRNDCTVLNSNIVHLVPLLHTEPLPYKFQESNKNVYISVCVCAFLVTVLLIGAVLVWRYKTTGSRCTVKEDNSPTTEMHGLLKEIQPKGFGNIVVLHSTDMKAEAKALCGFLREFVKCNAMCLDDDEVLGMLIEENDRGMLNLVNYTCTESKVGNSCDVSSEKKIIIFESKIAVDCDRYNEHCIISIDEKLDYLFNFSIHLLTSDFQKCLQDYCHIFVIRLNELSPIDESSPTGDVIRNLLVPAKRYMPVHPKHLVELYLNLNGIFSEPSKECIQYLLSTWSLSSSYQHLLSLLTLRASNYGLSV